MKKEDLFMRLFEIRDGFLKDSTNACLAQAMGKIYIEGYIMGLLNTGFINEDEHEEFLKKWCK